MLRTHTGQTGRDAYQYELAALVNAKRDLENRMSQLIDTICEELPADATSHWEMAAGHNVQLKKEDIVKMLTMWKDSIDPVCLETAQTIIANLQVGEAK